MYTVSGSKTKSGELRIEFYEIMNVCHKFTFKFKFLFSAFYFRPVLQGTVLEGGGASYKSFHG